mmetsp:Transcript_16443/g.51505  ORF Transcript_16443/g.51505 Transcript_16443/m.51505 type:complete len:384 (+) Transcript_16443:160-1311(+)
MALAVARGGAVVPRVPLRPGGARRGAGPAVDAVRVRGAEPGPPDRLPDPRLGRVRRNARGRVPSAAVLDARRLAPVVRARRVRGDAGLLLLRVGASPGVHRRRGDGGSTRQLPLRRRPLSSRQGLPDDRHAQDRAVQVLRDAPPLRRALRPLLSLPERLDRRGELSRLPRVSPRQPRPPRLRRLRRLQPPPRRLPDPAPRRRRLHRRPHRTDPPRLAHRHPQVPRRPREGPRRAPRRLRRHGRPHRRLPRLPPLARRPRHDHKRALQVARPPSPPPAPRPRSPLRPRPPRQLRRGPLAPRPPPAPPSTAKPGRLAPAIPSPTGRRRRRHRRRPPPPPPPREPRLRPSFPLSSLCDCPAHSPDRRPPTTPPELTPAPRSAKCPY